MPGSETCLQLAKLPVNATHYFISSMDKTKTNSPQLRIFCSLCKIIISEHCRDVLSEAGESEATAETETIRALLQEVSLPSYLDNFAEVSPERVFFRPGYRLEEVPGFCSKVTQII